MTASRRLAAILAADVVAHAYSRLDPPALDPRRATISQRLLHQDINRFMS
jgi:hypothetical protein